VDSKLTGKQPKKGTLNTRAASSPKMDTISYSVQIKPNGERTYTCERKGVVSCGAPQNVVYLLDGILSDLRVGAMNVNHLTGIIVTVLMQDYGVATHATE